MQIEIKNIGLLTICGILCCVGDDLCWNSNWNIKLLVYWQYAEYCAALVMTYVEMQIEISKYWFTDNMWNTKCNVSSEGPHQRKT